MNDYQLIDSGNGRKLERFGPYLIDRPCLAAFWSQEHEAEWEKAHAIFTREGQNNWTGLDDMPPQWVIEVAGIKFKISATDFGHLGIFAEQKPFWEWIDKKIREANRPTQVLNLFAYSGGSTLAAAKAGASVCHLDASKGMCDWARDNARLNHLDKAPIRWIVEDVMKFLRREITRGKHYDGIILDPPSFGRGAKGEVFKIEEQIIPLLQLCRELLSDTPLFLLLSCHTPGLTPIALAQLLEQTTQGLKGTIDKGEMVLEGRKSRFVVPSGTFARWVS